MDKASFENTLMSIVDGVCTCDNVDYQLFNSEECSKCEVTTASLSVIGECERNDANTFEVG